MVPGVVICNDDTSQEKLPLEEIRLLVFSINNTMKDLPMFRISIFTAAISLLPFGQPLIFGSATFLASGTVVFATHSVHAQSVGAYMDSGVEKGKRGDHQGAIADFNKALEINPQDPGTYYNRAVSYFELKKYHRAIADYNMAIKFFPQDFPAYSNRGTAKRAIGDHQGAIADFNKAIAINPQLTAAYVLRGYAKGLSGDQQGMCLDFRKGSSLGNENATKGLNQLCQ